MRSSFAARRPKARVVGQDADDGDEEERPKDVNAGGSAASRCLLFTWIRHLLTVSIDSSSRPKIKKRSSLRLSFGPDEASSTAEGGESFVPKKSALSRKAIEKNAARKSGLAAGAIGMERLNLTPGVEQPTYSKEYLIEEQRLYREMAQ
jgi:hypothetical protein